MRKKRRFEIDEGAPNDWLNTYADLMSLLLTFFVLLFSMSSVNANKFQTFIQSIGGGMGVKQISNLDLGSNQQSSNDQLRKIYNNLNKYISENQLKGSVKLVLNERGLIIRFVDGVLFDTGKADLKPESIIILDKISSVLKSCDYPIKVEGHTDDVPIYNSKYPSNWELSTDRAVTVLKHLVNKHGISPERLSAEGFGEYRPIVPNTSDSNRAKNRRVDIVILRNGS